jgi:Protein of unknown function (DUF3999)
MSRALISCLSAVAAAMLLGGALRAQQPAPSFGFERPVVAAAGAQRLAVDVPLLAGGAPFRVVQSIDESTGEVSATAVDGLADLRLFGSDGREVPYLLIANPPSKPIWQQVSAVLPIAAVETERLKTSGFEVDLGAAVAIDRFRMEGLRPPFLKRVRLEGSGDRARWTLLVDEGTVFDLPDLKLQQTALGFPPGTFRYLRVTWDDTRSGRISPPDRISVRLTTSVAQPPPLTTPVIFDRRPSEPGRSRFRVRLPAGRLPIVALEVDVAGARVLREATISQARLVGGEVVPATIGRGTLRRAEYGSLAATSLRVPIAGLTEAEVDLEVDDGSNPPLEVRGITAVFAELPWVYLESDGTALTARYGNASLRAPKYDLEAARNTVKIEQVPEAKWGEARRREPEENTQPTPLPAAGSAIEPSLFRYTRSVPAGADRGLVALRLDPAVLAHSRGVGGRFRDVRVIDGSARQVPYLVERSAEPQSLDLTLEQVADPPRALGRATPSRSVYRIRWPYERLPAPRLVLTTSARVFERPVAAMIERRGGRQIRDSALQTLASARWVHADQSSAAPALTLPLPDFEASDVLLVIEEGDNSPLPVSEARLLLPSYRLRFFREQNAALRLMYGRADLDAPRYDLALLAPQLLGAPAQEIAAGEEQGGSATDSPLVSPRLFWVLLAAAVVALIALIVRLLREDTKGTKGTKDTEESTSESPSR